MCVREREGEREMVVEYGKCVREGVCVCECVSLCEREKVREMKV